MPATDQEIKELRYLAESEGHGQTSPRDMARIDQIGAKLSDAQVEQLPKRIREILSGDYLLDGE